MAEPSNIPKLPILKNEHLASILEHKLYIHPDRASELISSLDEDGSIYELPEIYNFLTALDETGFNVLVDYNSWIEETNQGDNWGFFTNEDFVENASLDELRMLMTAHVRTERFSPGHLKELFSNGYVAAVMDRIEELSKLK